MSTNTPLTRGFSENAVTDHWDTEGSSPPLSTW